MEKTDERYLSRTLAANEFSLRLDQYRLQLELRQYWEEELDKPRYRDSRRLLRHGYKIYSQFDEDGIIEEIFRRIGSEHRTFIEFGVETGKESNSTKLLFEGWGGLWIDGSEANISRIRSTHKYWIDRSQLKIINSFITAENINGLIDSSNIGPIDILIIDIDQNDYWVWRSINSIQPRVVVIEYNPLWRPPMSVVVPYHPQRTWNGSSYCGASLEALVKLGNVKGYRLVGCGFSGVNAFFVRTDLCSDHFLPEATSIEHYEPARFFMLNFQAAHPPEIGPLVTID